MSPEEYAVHCERILYLSEHPLVDRHGEDANPELEETRQATLEVFAG